MKLFNHLYFTLLGCALANPLAQDHKVTYDGFGVYRLPVGDDVSKMASLIENLGLETWKSFKKPGAYADVVVPPEKLSAFKEQTAGIEGVEVMHEDLAKSIAAEQEPAMITMSDVSLAAINSTWFTAYHSYADHLSYLSNLATKYPSNAAVTTSGNSLQGNTITGIHIYGSTGGGVKPAVVFHGTVHAREWITTMVSQSRPQTHENSAYGLHLQVVEYFADALLSGYGTDAALTAFVDKYDFYFFPVVNPDGKYPLYLVV